MAVFRIFRKDGKLASLLDRDNRYDMAMLVWCLEADRREQKASIPEGAELCGDAYYPSVEELDAASFEPESETETEATKTEPSTHQPSIAIDSKFIFLPSEKLKAMLRVYENHIVNSTPEGHQSWELMAASMITAYRTFYKTGELSILFDFSNPFDTAMHAWCVEVDRSKAESASKATALAKLN